MSNPNPSKVRGGITGNTPNHHLHFFSQPTLVGRSGCGQRGVSEGWKALGMCVGGWEAASIGVPGVGGMHVQCWAGHWGVKGWSHSGGGPQGVHATYLEGS